MITGSDEVVDIYCRKIGDLIQEMFETMGIADKPLEIQTYALASALALSVLDMWSGESGINKDPVDMEALASIAEQIVVVGHALNEYVEQQYGLDEWESKDIGMGVSAESEDEAKAADRLLESIFGSDDDDEDE